MNRAVSEWARNAIPTPSPDDQDSLAKQLGRSYTVYGTLLLLPSLSSDTSPWKSIEQRGHGAQEALFRCIAKHMKITHIATTKPIPPRNDDLQESENVVRSPAKFTPLYGDFGPPMKDDPPTLQDFEAEYWTTAKQNGISQTWAPRRIMFSRGNIKEKARILELPTVAEAVEQGRESGRGCVAVDLYAGIGYFTFSYAKAGVDKVLCWDLNPWSIEGLRRGAVTNKWQALLHDVGSEVSEIAQSDARLLVFNESNECACERVKAMRQYLPPVRHVNCGLLPTSKGSWETAFAVLDSESGGWVHVHENFDQREIEQKSEEVRLEFQRLLDETDKRSGNVALELINRVKTYAPGVYHVVLDIYIPPHSASPGDEAPS